jgi:hypothetical protein
MYQYGFPLIIFLYRLATTLGHRRSGHRKQADTPRNSRSRQLRRRCQLIKIEIARKLGLAGGPSDFVSENRVMQAMQNVALVAVLQVTRRARYRLARIHAAACRGEVT